MKTGIAGWFEKKDPYEVILKSESGDERAWAYAQLEEPLRNGGTQQDQDRIVMRLNVAAKSERTVPARLGAIQALARFKDARAVAGLEDAFYAADDFGPVSATVIRSQVLTAMGEVGHVNGVKLLTRVLNAPPIDEEASIEERQNSLDERLAAARALGKFKHPEAATALEQVLKTEKDVALRDRARESLQVVTGRELPPDAPFLDRLRHQIQPNRNQYANQPPSGNGIRRTGGPQPQPQPQPQPR